MSMPDNNRRHAKRVATLIAANRSENTGIFDGLWHWIHGVASGIGHLIGGPIASTFRAIGASIKSIVQVSSLLGVAIGRVAYWVKYHLVIPLENWVKRELAALRARQSREVRFLVGLIYSTTQYVLVVVHRHIRAETSARRRAIGNAEHRARQEIRHLHGTIEREAQSGYSLERDARTAVIVRLLEFAIERDPLLRDLVSTIITGLLDLLTIDDPPARLLIGFLIRKIIDRLGVDAPVGTLVRDLAAPILGQAKPRGLHDVIAEIAARISAVEKWQAEFMLEGGSQVEQAGREWKNITSVAGNLTITAFAVQAVIDPYRWAREVNDTIGRAASDVASAAADIFRGH